MKKVYKNLEETVYYYQFKNGLKACLIPNNNFDGVSAGISFHCGSTSSNLIFSNNNKKTLFLPGIAHFLEHRIFDYKKGPVFDLFSNLGASSNAYTTFDKTVYYIKTSENVLECIDLLLKFTNDFLVSETSVEKEKPIIIEEVKMYQDYPDHISQMKILGQLYHYHSVKLDIGGDEESVSKTTLADLQNFHQYFYHPSNAILYITGNFELKETVGLIRKFKSKKARHGELINNLKVEPDTVVKESGSQKMDVSTPNGAIGFKLKPFLEKDKAKKIIAIQVLLDMLFSSNNKIYEDMLNQNIINNSFVYTLSYGDGFNYLYFYSESNKYQEFFEIIKETIHNKEKYLNKKLFNIIKNNLIGIFIKSIDNPTAMINNLVSNSWSHIEYLDEFKILKNLKLNDVINSLTESDFQNFTTFVIEPK